MKKRLSDKGLLQNDSCEKWIGGHGKENVTIAKLRCEILLPCSQAQDTMEVENSMIGGKIQMPAVWLDTSYLKEILASLTELPLHNWLTSGLESYDYCSWTAVKNGQRPNCF